MISKPLPLPSLQNTRSLQGIINKDGWMIKENCLFRSGKLACAQPQDLFRLNHEYDVKTIIDLRNPQEAIEAADPIELDQRVILHTIMPQSVLGITHEKSEKVLDKEYQAIHTPFQAKKHMENFYRFMATNRYCQSQWKQFFQLILTNQDHAILWHCSLGKDRCGVATALLLLACDVDQETIIEDYLATNHYLYPNQVCQHTINDYHQWAFREYIEAFFVGMQQTSGSIDLYLKEVLAISDKEKRLLKQRYLQQPVQKEAEN